MLHGILMGVKMNEHQHENAPYFRQISNRTNETDVFNKSICGDVGRKLFLTQQKLIDIIFHSGIDYSAELFIILVLLSV